MNWATGGIKRKRRLRSSWTMLGDGLTLVIIKFCLRWLLAVLDCLIEIPNSLTKLDPSMQTIIGAVVAAGGSDRPPARSLIGFIIPILMGPVGIVVAVVAVVVAIGSFIASNETARRVISDVWNGIKKFISTAIGAILGFYADMADRISKIGLLPDAVQRKMASLSKSLKAGSKAVFDWGKKTKEAQVKVKPAIKETKKFAEVFNNPKKPKTGLNPVMDEAEKKAEALRKQQDKLKKSFADTLNPSKKLGEKLKVLVDEFDREDVVEAHWEQILKATRRECRTQHGARSSG